DDGKGFELSPRKLEPLVRRIGVRLSAVSLVFPMHHLLHPKARGRAVQEAKEGEVVLLGRAGGELDDRRASIEDLSAAVEDEVVVRRDEGEGDGEGRAESLAEETTPLVPCEAKFTMVSVRLSAQP